MSEWGGRRAVAERRFWAGFLPLPCGRCGRPVTADQKWDVGHRVSRSADPGGTWDRDNMWPEHAKCNRSAGARAGNARVRARRVAARNGSAVPASMWGELSGLPQAPPRFFSAPHPDAVGSLYDTFGVEAAGLLGVVLFDWQRLVLERALEVDGEGRLCWSTVVVSVSRQSGKSVLLRVLAVARALYGADVGVPQFMAQVARDRMAASRLMVRDDARRLAEGLGVAVKAGQGYESWVWPDGSMWKVVAQGGAYGETTHLLICDETWDITEDNYWQGLYPTTTVAENAQRWIVSAAHEKARPLLLQLRAAGLDPADSDVMIAEWSADPDAEVDDPRVWWLSSPQWSQTRFDSLRGALRGPVGAFRAQYLNVWPQIDGVAGAGAVAFPGWDAAPLVDGGPPAGLAGGLEMSSDGSTYGVAAAMWGDRPAVWCRVVGSLSDAEGVLRGWGVRWVVAGASFAKDVSLPVSEGVSRQVRDRLPMVQQLLREGRLAHDHDDGARVEFDRARVYESESGLVLSARRSGGSVASCKAAVWALDAAKGAEASRPIIAV